MIDEHEVDEEWLTPPEAAALLKVMLQTLANWRWQQVGPPYVRLGDGARSPIRYPRSGLLQWLADHQGDVSGNAA